MLLCQILHGKTDGKLKPGNLLGGASIYSSSNMWKRSDADTDGVKQATDRSYRHTYGRHVYGDHVYGGLVYSYSLVLCVFQLGFSNCSLSHTNRRTCDQKLLKNLSNLAKKTLFHYICLDFWTTAI